MLRRFNDQDPQPTNGEDQLEDSPTSLTNNRPSAEIANMTRNGRMRGNVGSPSSGGNNLATISVLTLI